MSRSCPVCGRGHSEFDPACPGCGAPLPTSSGASPLAEALAAAPAAAAPPAATPATATPAIPGTRLDRFEILGELGRGGMGVVYRARDLELGREVALKLLSPGERGGAERQRVLQEARAVAALDHPAIGTLYEVGTIPACSFLVLALYQGRTLAAELAERGALPALEAVEILRQLAGALAAAHGAGILHRDVKPSNVFRLGDGRIKLLDFGIARQRDDAASGGQQPLGTAAYMAPERLAGEPAGAAADVWSLGVLGWELAAGSHPFDLSRPGWLARVQAGGGELPAPSLPPGLGELLRACLTREPARRPGAAEVESALAGLAEELRPAAAARERSGARRWGALAAGLLVAALAAFWAWPREAARVVMVLEPRVDGEMAAADRQRLAANLEASSWRVLLGLRGIEAVDRAQARQAKGDPVAAARATAADETLAWEAGCPGRDLCSARLWRRDASGKVLGSESLELSAASDAITSRAAAAAVQRVYPGWRRQPGAGEPEPDAAFYQRYLELRSALDRRTIAPEKALAELEGLVGNGAPPAEASALAAGLCRFLLARDRDPRWLARGLAAADGGLTRTPGDAMLLATRFDLLLEAREMPAARQAYGALERSGAGLADLLLRRARLEEAEGHPEEALALLRRLAADRPAGYILLTLANLEERLGHGAEARRHLALAIERAPENLAARAQLAGLDLSEGRLELAAEGWRQLAETTPTIDALTNHGLALMLARRYEEALEVYRRAHQLDPRHAETRLNLADTLVLVGRREEASALYRGLADEIPAGNGWQLWAVRAQALAQLDLEGEARAALDEMLRRAPDNGAAATSAALVLTLLGDAPAALAEARRAQAAGSGAIWFELPFFDPLAGPLAAEGLRQRPQAGVTDRSDPAGRPPPDRR